MTNYTNCSDRERLNILLKETKQEPTKKQTLFSRLNSIWQHIVKSLIQEQELKIWQSTDRFGNTQWYAYDPVTDSSVTRDSEAEMRVWVEQHYYQ
jgi:hypothetical protein